MTSERAVPLVRCSAKRREAARYLLDNMPYHYGYGVTVSDSEEVGRWAEETAATLPLLPHVFMEEI